MLTEPEERILRDAANLLRLKGRNLIAAMVMTELDDLGGPKTLTRDEQRQKYQDMQAAVNAACTRRPA